MRKLVFFGYSMDEYRKMFDLSLADMDSKILEYGCDSNRDLNSPLLYPDFAFDYALSAHFLFGGLKGQTVDLHLQVIHELARVAKEVRIFPLIDQQGKTSEFLGPVLLQLQKEGYGVEVRDVDCHAQHAENAMLRVWAQKCDL